MTSRFVIVSFFNGLGDTLLLLPVLRILHKEYERVVILAHLNSKPLLLEFECVCLIDAQSDVPDIPADIHAQLLSSPGAVSYYDFNIPHNPIKDWVLIQYSPAFIYDYQRIQCSEMKDEYESKNMFHKNFILADLWPLSAEIDRKPFIPASDRKEVKKGGKKIITIHTDTDPNKQWGLPSWKTIITCIEKNFHDFEIILVGFPDKSLKKKNIKVAPDFFSCLLAIQNSCFFIGVDSVFAHAADALEIDGLVMFGDVKHSDWMPTGTSMHHIKAPAGKMYNIRVDQVLEFIRLFTKCSSTTYELLQSMYIKDYRAIEHAPIDIRSDAELMKRLLPLCPYIYPYLEQPLKTNNELIQQAVSSFWYMICFVPEDYRTDQLCRIALEKSGWALQFVNEKMKSDRNTIQMAVTSKGDALEFAPPQYRSERDIVLMAVRENGMAIQYAHSSLWFDDEIVETALENDPFAIEFAPTDIRTASKWTMFCKERHPDTEILLNKIN